MPGELDAVQEETLSVTQTARVLRIGRNQAYRLARAGVLPSFRSGRRIVVPVRALRRFLETAGRDITPSEPGTAH